MDNGSHDGGSGNEGFHSYLKSPQPPPAPVPALAPAPSSGVCISKINRSTVMVIDTAISGFLLELSREKGNKWHTATETSMGLPAHLNQAITECIIREQDRFMPLANVVRIMRRILPSHAKISDESKLTIQECISEFISFITMEANDRCKHEQCKTITAEDILWAMSKFGLDAYIKPLTLYLHRYRAFDCGEGGSMGGEPFPLKHPRAHHHGYFVHPPSNVSTSQCAVAAGDREVESPAKEGKE